MKAFLAFTQKEFIEQIRTYKTFILLVVFIFFGMSSPLLAKMMPKIFESMNIEGMQIVIPTPTFLDAYGQFFKNLTQMGMIVVLLVFSASLPQEIMKGTLVNMLSKGLPRSTVILSKYTAALLLWTVSFSLASAVNYGYTVYLFGQQSINTLLFSHFCLWLFGAFVLAVILAAGTLASGNYGGLLVTALILGALLAINMFPKITAYNPISLAANNLALLSGAVTVESMAKAIWITLAGIVLSLSTALCIFQKKKL